MADGKSTVRHTLNVLRVKDPIQPITQGCILDHCEPDIKEHWRQALRIQKSIRGQYYRMIAAHPEQAHSLTYKLNCPPSGFYVMPWTQTCENPRACPWCFARRLRNVYDVLMGPNRKFRILHRLVGWHREVPIDGKLPFFRADYGPHLWLKASVTVQMVVPFFQAATGSLQLRHIGIQLTSKKEWDFAEKLKRNCVNPPLTSFTYNTTNPANTYKVFNTVMRFPWLDLYLASNRGHFEKLMDLYPKQQLLRISRYNPEGAKDGHRFPAFSKGIDKPGATVLGSE